MKIIFIGIPMKELSESRDKLCYGGTGNTNCTFGEKVYFPINALLASGEIKKDDEVKVVLLKTVTEKGNAETNAALLKSELDSINKKIGAKITYTELNTNFVETKDIHEKRMRAMLSEFEEGAELYADITFGQKPIPMMLMCAMNFGEKFFNTDIKKVVYGKVDFVMHGDGKFYLENPELYDVSSLYYLNNITSSMKDMTGDTALKALDEFFAL